ncbi:hypothetical protein ACQEU8_36665 [Streptomyces sp. CA-250714]|uniref:hypothetical protein n=1 Tax=Streptomyces sp. CA-250714 TaxID=3240060 RepID=UPI003D8BB389
MARNIGADGRTVYRAVLTLTGRSGEQWTEYEGPYSKAGHARGRLSFWRSYMRRSGGDATGHVEQAHTVWAPVDQPDAQRTAEASSGNPLLRLVELYEETGTPRHLAPGYAAELFAALARELADALPEGPDRASILARAARLDARGEQVLGPKETPEQQ